MLSFYQIQAYKGKEKFHIPANWRKETYRKIIQQSKCRDEFIKFRKTESGAQTAMPTEKYC
jgi:hypothetical protein